LFGGCGLLFWEGGWEFAGGSGVAGMTGGLEVGVDVDVGVGVGVGGGGGGGATREAELSACSEAAVGVEAGGSVVGVNGGIEVAGRSPDSVGTAPGGS